MKKICFVCPTVLLKRPIAEIIACLEKNEIALITPKDLIKGIVNIHFNKFHNARVFTYLTINPPFSSSEWPIPINPLFFIQILKILSKYDIIHLWVPFYIFNTAFILLKRMFFPNKKIYLTMDTIPAYSFKTNPIMDNFFKIFYKTFGRLIFSSINKVILYCNSMRSFALKVGIPDHKIEIIPTGANSKIIKKDRSIRKEFGIEKDIKIVLYVGLLNHRKGIDLIIRTAIKLNSKKIIFILVGDGQRRQYYEKLIEENNLTERIIFTGFREDVYNFYSEVDLLLFPSRGEGLAGVLMESMIYGVPIVTSDISGTKDLIEDNINGFLCKTNDIDCYVKKINILLGNQELKEKFITNSKKKVKNLFSWDKNIIKFKKLYL